jgi:hypothetical protein
MENLKAHLWKLTWLYCVNARLKCWQTKRSYCATIKRYAGMMSNGPDIPLENLRQDEWKHLRPRVFFMGTDEQQDKSRFV